MCHLIPTNTTVTAVETAEQFLHYIVVKYHGLPRSIISDRDSKLMSHFWQALCRRLDIKMRSSSAFRPQTNGQAERANQTMKQVFRTLIAQGRLWYDMLDSVEIARTDHPFMVGDQVLLNMTKST